MIIIKVLTIIRKKHLMMIKAKQNKTKENKKRKNKQTKQSIDPHTRTQNCFELTSLLRIALIAHNSEDLFDYKVYEIIPCWFRITMLTIIIP